MASMTTKPPRCTGCRTREANLTPCESCRALLCPDCLGTGPVCPWCLESARDETRSLAAARIALGAMALDTPIAATRKTERSAP